jgi:aryl-alcohol dehydrogenase-like predicted oxidoreductase
MQRREITRTTVAVTELGFGAAVIGNHYRATSEHEALDAVAAAWDAGIRYFDTAPHYGLGLSEQRLGAALRDYPRDEYVLSSKVGRLLVPNEHPQGTDTEGFAVPDDLRREWDFSKDGVLRSIEATLRPVHGAKYDYQDAPSEVVTRARAIAEVCEAHGTTLPAAAIAFPFTHPAVVNVTLGMRSREQVERNARLHADPVPEALWAELRDQGLIRFEEAMGLLRTDAAG